MTGNTTRDVDGRLILAGWVKALAPDEIFVFGSNAGGRHAGGAARIAHDRFGAVWGQGHGLHGPSYAIDTMTDAATMAAEIGTFLLFAAAHPELTFLVTELGCGIGSYEPADVAPLLAGAGENVALPLSFSAELRRRGVGVPRQVGSGASAPAHSARSGAESRLAGRVGAKHHGRPAPARLTAQQLDRAAGSVVGMAIGDALGSQYEFGPAHGDEFVPQFGRGVFGHGVREWTDDTSMAMPILEALARGESLRDPAVLGAIAGEWDAWARTAKDVGSQTRTVLAAMRGVHTEAAARTASEAHHLRTGRSGGNGSLMRTGPVALSYLSEGRETRLAEAAGRVAQLTHWERDNVDAAVIWSLMIRQAVRTGEIELFGFEPLFGSGSERWNRWAALIDVSIGRHPRDLQEHNGWVVRAFQSALAAVFGATDFRDAIHRAIRGGGDTDTVAAIAGALAGARFGLSQIPLSWQRRVHGWPGYRTNDLVRLAILATRRGTSDSRGWPAGDRVLDPTFRHTAPVRHPHDEGVWLGSQSALGMLPASVGAVVSLGRVGAQEVPDGLESVRVWLIDAPGENLGLDYTLTEAADVVAELRAEGVEVFVHCAEARSRTSAVAALYAVRHRGVMLDDAWRDLSRTLPYFAPAAFLWEAVERIVGA